jgi:phosphoribosylformylglycinamidine cyclo-ligase
MGGVSDAYAAAGVDTSQAAQSIDGLVAVLQSIQTGNPSRSVLPSGHYAAVLRIAPNLGLALATDSVGSKLILAEQTQRFDTIGIDCMAMNVNDLVCVGAEPIALLDYIAVEQVDSAMLTDIAKGLKAGAEDAGVEIPGGEVCQIPELLKGHPSPYGFDLVGAAVGTVALDAIVTGADCAPGDAVLGLPSSGLHSNGYTLARHVLLGETLGAGPFTLDDTPAELGGASIADALLEPTIIYVRAALDLIRSDIPVHGLAHITGDGLGNLLRLTGERAGFAIESPLPVPPIFDLISRHGDVSVAEMWEVFNMGCGLVAVVPADREADAIALLSERHPGTARIGTVTDAGGTIAAPSLGIAGDRHGLRAAD